jgi:hypothetical protein
MVVQISVGLLPFVNKIKCVRIITHASFSHNAKSGGGGSLRAPSGGTLLHGR